MNRALGYHLLLEFHGCPPETLEKVEYVEKAMKEAARVSRANVVDTFFHQFNPHGVSGVIVIQESHLSIHTWPEHGYAAVDLFTCSEDVDVEKAIEYLRSAFRPSSVSVVELRRGIV
ncbi:adenosylmethionine decarboxylase [bacterium]|nr:MAG: adenosylmethionine decarboxylase [bacterium]